MRTRKSTSARGITTLAACAPASAAPGSAKNNKRIISLGAAFRIFRMGGLSRGFVLCLFVMLWAWPGMPSTALGQNGRIDWSQIVSDALTNNLLYDSARRWVGVYLPPSYDSTQKRYPVVYMLHGYTGNPCGMVVALQPALDSMTAARTIGEMIVVFPDGNNRLQGSHYLSSPVIGDYETYIAKDLVAYIDAHYRTLATRDSRGITGVSMGGWGSMHLALKFPDVFSVVVPNAGYYDAVGDSAVWIWQNFAPYHPTNLVEFDRLDFPWNWAQSVLAGVLPDLQRPPMYTDYPYELINGQVVAVEAALQRLRDSDVFHGDLGRYLKQPVRLNAIKVVCGTNDSLIIDARAFTNALTAAGVEFTYEEHPGGHMYVPELSLPFLSDNLEGAELYVAPPLIGLSKTPAGLQLSFPCQCQQGVDYNVESAAALDGTNTIWTAKTHLIGDGQAASVPLPMEGDREFFRVRTGNPAPRSSIGVELASSGDARAKNESKQKTTERVAVVRKSTSARGTRPSRFALLR